MRDLNGSAAKKCIDYLENRTNTMKQSFLWRDHKTNKKTGEI